MSTLKSQFPSRNQTIQWFNKKFCRWGRKRTGYDIDDRQLGSAAPLWSNPSERFYTVFYYINLVCSAIFIIFFVIVLLYNAGNKAAVATISNSTALNSTTANTTTINSASVPSSTTANNSTSGSNSTTANNSTANNSTTASNSTISNNSTNSVTGSSVNSTVANTTAVNSTSAIIVISSTTAAISPSITALNVSSANSTSGNSTFDNSTECFSSIQKYLQPELIVIGSSILFVNGIIFL